MGSLICRAIDQDTFVTTAGVSIPLYMDRISRISIHQEHGDITGTYAVYVSNDPRARPDHWDYANADWDDRTAGFALTDPAGAAADETLEFDNVNWSFIRIAITKAAGTEHLRVTVRGV